MNIKSFKVTCTIWLLSLTLWSFGSPWYRIRSLDTRGASFSVVILSEVLGVYSKALGWFYLWEGYYDYMLCLWLRIPLYTAVTLPNFYEDLTRLKLDISQRFSIFSCLVSIQRMGILHWLLMSSVGFLSVRSFFFLINLDLGPCIFKNLFLIKH